MILLRTKLIHHSYKMIKLQAKRLDIPTTDKIKELFQVVQNRPIAEKDELIISQTKVIGSSCIISAWTKKKIRKGDFF